MPDEATRLLQQDVADALLDIGGVGFVPDAPLTFKSGMQSPVYCDNRLFPFHPAQWRKVIAGFEQLIAREALGFNVLGGIESAGIPHSAALGFAMRRPSIFIRKEAKTHGTKRRVEGGKVSGCRVLLVEDLVTTGSSSLAGVQALRDEGATSTDCLAIISYGFREAGEQFAAAGVRLHTLTTFDTVLERAETRGMLDAETAANIREWLRSPHTWKPVAPNPRKAATLPSVRP